MGRCAPLRLAPHSLNVISIEDRHINSLKIILADFYAFFSTMFAVGFVLAFSIAIYLNPAKLNDNISFILITTFTPFLLSYYRVKNVKQLLSQGIKQQGTVTQAIRGYSAGADTIRYKYQINGKPYIKRFILMFSNINLNVGDNVTVLMDKNNNKKSIIMEPFQ